MKKLIPFLFIIILLAPAVSAAPLEVSVTPQNAEVYSGDTIIYNLSVTSGLSEPTEFEIIHSGEHLEWKFPGKVRITAEPGKTVTAPIAFTPGKEEGTFTFTATLESLDSKISASDDYSMAVTIPPVVTFEEMGLTKDGRYLYLDLEMRVREPLDIEVSFEVLDSSGQAVMSFTESGHFYRTGSISKTVILEELTDGDYTVKASYGGQDISEGFSIEAVHDVSERTESASNFLYEEVRIEVFNNGNFVERNYEVTAHIPAGDFATGFFFDPYSCSPVEDGQLCSFFISELRPGEREEIVYRMDFWPSYTKIVASVLIIALFLGIYLVWISRPKLKKSYVRKSGREHHVILEVKAPRHRSLKNVIVRDWVSPLAQVMQQEFKHARPILRKSDAGTEIIWKLGDIAAREERILSYKINTLVQGHLKMPRAYIRYSDKKDSRVRVYSRPGIIG